MTATRTMAITALGFVLSGHSAHAQDQLRYRDFPLGSSVSTISTAAKLGPADAKTIHSRPALMQELEWRPQYFSSATVGSKADPVEKIVFSFYNDQLSKMVVDYDHDRTAGMTGADIIEALSISYGPADKPVLRTARTTPTEIDGNTSVAIARWGDADFAVVLYRADSSYGSTASTRFQLVVSSPRLDALAQNATVQARRQDQREAPQLETARHQKEIEDARLAAAQAREANVAAFRP
jgi:hypothetical protein